MLSDDLCAVSWQARPGSFVSLMTLYESNFIRLGWVVSEFRELPVSQVSTVDGDCALRLRVLERGPYTTTLSLAYLFDVDGEYVADPELGVRVYHDARLVEALGPARRTAHPELGRIQERVHRFSLGAARDGRWKLNVMLNKWLEYCAERGHRFATGSG
jgi:uncharacterized protein